MNAVIQRQIPVAPATAATRARTARAVPEAAPAPRGRPAAAIFAVRPAAVILAVSQERPVAATTVVVICRWLPAAPTVVGTARTARAVPEAASAPRGRPAAAILVVIRDRPAALAPAAPRRTAATTGSAVAQAKPAVEIKPAARLTSAATTTRSAVPQVRPAVETPAARLTSAATTTRSAVPLVRPAAKEAPAAPLMIAVVAASAGMRTAAVLAVQQAHVAVPHVLMTALLGVVRARNTTIMEMSSGLITTVVRTVSSLDCPWVAAASLLGVYSWAYHQR